MQERNREVAGIYFQKRFVFETGSTKGREKQILFIMNKKGLIEAVMKAADIETKAAAERAVEGVFDTIVKTLGRGEEVAITGFGTFRVAKRAAREGRNPATGEKIQIKASIKPKFRAGKLLKEAVM
jgi:DNA-binding protein HU-beta